MSSNKIVDLEKTRMMLKLRRDGFKAYEDERGQFRLWLRKTAQKPKGRIISVDFVKTR